jgi:hypothetical protein
MKPAVPDIPQGESKPESLDSLPERVEKYRQTVERVVTTVGEHPNYEMKRSCALNKLAEKIEFVKDVQSIATSLIEGEKYLIIGADEKSNQFFPVANPSDFDESKIRQMLSRYLSPVPNFEVFQLTSSAGHSFVLFVIPRQRQRRILAKVTVLSDDTSDLTPKLLLREGDLWTKGSSTSKRLATPQDWEEIYEETVEAESERRAKSRTAHMVELAIARDKFNTTDHFIPSVFTDNEFQALMEELCARKDEAGFRIVLERFRDDLVEAWNELAAFEPLALSPTNSLPETIDRVRNHVTNILRPAMHWLTLAGIFVIKNSGPIGFLDSERWPISH